MAMTDISKNAMEVLKRRYLAKDENGKLVDIAFKNVDKFNFAFDVVDRIDDNGWGALVVKARK